MALLCSLMRNLCFSPTHEGKKIWHLQNIMKGNVWFQIPVFEWVTLLLTNNICMWKNPAAFKCFSDVAISACTMYLKILKKVSQVSKNIKQHNCFQQWLYIIYLFIHSFIHDDGHEPVALEMKCTSSTVPSLLATSPRGSFHGGKVSFTFDIH